MAERVNHVPKEVIKIWDRSKLDTHFMELKTSNRQNDFIVICKLESPLICLYVRVQKCKNLKENRQK